jgi:hypothetical protein
MDTLFWRGKLKDRNQFEDLDLGKAIILKWILKKLRWRPWVEINWFRIGTIGELF